MRNLKKFLALVLAMMMAFSLMLTVNAASFDDAADINTDYTTAADVLDALGVIKGNGSNYYPKAYITRGEFAAILYRVATGDAEEKNVAQYKSDAAAFPDVSSTAWYAGQVGYAARNGLLKGAGDGNYWPNGKVTSTEVVIGLLRALGYDANGELVGTQAGVNALIYGGRANILNGVGPYNINDSYANREMVAQLAFDTLNARLVVWREGDGTYVNDGTNATTLGAARFGLKRLYGSGTAAEQKIHTEAIAPDEFGRPGADQVWVAKNNTIVIPIAAEPVKTFDTKMKAGAAEKALKDLGITKVAKDDDGNNVATVYQNGVELPQYETAINATTGISTAIGNGAAGDGSSVLDFATSVNNNTVEVFVNDDNEITNVVIINEFAQKLEKNDVVAAKGNTDAYIVLHNVGTGPYAQGLAASFKYYTDEFEVGDIVVYTRGTDGTVAENSEKDETNGVVIVTAENVTDTAFTGTLTKVDVKKDQDTIYTIDGKTYVAADNGHTLAPTNLGKDDYTFYLNSKGQVVFAESPVAAPTPFGNYAIVLDGGIAEPTLSKGAPTVTVQLLTSKGTLETYTMKAYTGAQLKSDAMKVTPVGGGDKVTPSNYANKGDDNYYIILEDADPTKNTAILVQSSTSGTKDWKTDDIAKYFHGYAISGAYTPVQYIVSGSSVSLIRPTIPTTMSGITKSGAYSTVMHNDGTIEKNSTSTKLNIGGDNYVYINSDTVFILSDGKGGYVPVKGSANLGDTEITNAKNKAADDSTSRVVVILDVTVPTTGSRVAEVKYVFAPNVEYDEGDGAVGDAYYYVDPANYIGTVTNEDGDKEYAYTAITAEGDEETVVVSEKISDAAVYHLSEDGDELVEASCKKGLVREIVGTTVKIGSNTSPTVTVKDPDIAVNVGEATGGLQKGAYAYAVVNDNNVVIALWITADPE